MSMLLGHMCNKVYNLKTTELLSSVVSPVSQIKVTGFCPIACVEVAYECQDAFMIINHAL